MICHQQRVSESFARLDERTMIEKEDLLKVARWKMPFGKFQGKRLIELPEEYLLWFVDRGFPEGELGLMMQLTLEIKINGLEKLIFPLMEDEE